MRFHTSVLNGHLKEQLKQLNWILCLGFVAMLLAACDSSSEEYGLNPCTDNSQCTSDQVCIVGGFVSSFDGICVPTRDTCEMPCASDESCVLYTGSFGQIMCKTNYRNRNLGTLCHTGSVCESGLCAGPGSQDLPVGTCEEEKDACDPECADGKLCVGTDECWERFVNE